MKRFVNLESIIPSQYLGRQVDRCIIALNYELVSIFVCKALKLALKFISIFTLIVAELIVW